MLTINQVISYITRSLGHPFVPIEYSSDQLIPFIQEDALSHFTKYVPDTNRIVLDLSKPEQIRVNPKVKNYFWIKDPDERQVLTVINVARDYSSYLANGYPVFMPYTSTDMAVSYTEIMSNSNIATKFSKTDLTWKQDNFTNKLWIFSEDSLSTLFNVRYTRTHDLSLSTIPEEYNQIFKDTALAFVMKGLGEIRKKYSTLNTPINEIQIDTSIGDRGETLLSKCTEELEKKALVFTPVYVD